MININELLTSFPSFEPKIMGRLCGTSFEITVFGINFSEPLVSGLIIVKPTFL